MANLKMNYQNPSSSSNWAPIMSEMVADSDHLYILAMDNVLHILDLKTGKEVEQYCFKLPVRPFIVLDSKMQRIYLGSTTGELMPYETI